MQRIPYGDRRLRAAYLRLCPSIGLCLVGTPVQASFEKLRLVLQLTRQVKLCLVGCKGIIRNTVWSEGKEFSSPVTWERLAGKR